MTKSKQVNMVKKTSIGAVSGSARSRTKSPAEFFAEHQNIAGFDNSGKSLYTTVRELVENALDAAEAVRRLPVVRLTLQHLNGSELAEARGIKAHTRVDEALYSSQKHNRASSVSHGADDASNVGQGGAIGEDSIETGPQYFIVSCKDNGCGMPHEEIPRMLGVVLSSTKYEVKQTRGKFGLGAKMALVWAKKSTGVPIEVYSSQDPDQLVSYFKLDIDIYKNEPIVVIDQRLPNTLRWVGTEVIVTIEGGWASYRARLLAYLRQLAIITPYAQIEFSYKKRGDVRKNFSLAFSRRTERIPPAPAVVKHHPSSVDNIMVSTLIKQTRVRKLLMFLTSEFACITRSLASRLIAELGSDFAEDVSVKDLDRQQINRLTRLLNEAKFPAPDGKCLSPAGEYNLRLGIFKEIKPEFVSTAVSPAAVYEGHPFIVEAGVSIGGTNAKVGVTVYRFANRIPLLFEGGNDVVSKVANLKIKWAYYKMRPKIDKIGVYVSIVSTKIPFKGTSKEYIGDDNGVLHESIKAAITQCCKQLKPKITRHASLKMQQDRKRNMLKYVPTVVRSLCRILEAAQHGGDEFDDDETRIPKRAKIDDAEVTPEVLTERLSTFIEQSDADTTLKELGPNHMVKEERMIDVYFTSSHRFKYRALIRNREAGYDLALMR